MQRRVNPRQLISGTDLTKIRSSLSKLGVRFYSTCRLNSTELKEGPETPGTQRAPDSKSSSYWQIDACDDFLSSRLHMSGDTDTDELAR